MSRIAIAGGPRAGKSTLARTIQPGAPILCTDPRGLVKDLEVGVEYVPDTHQEWSAASLYVAERFLSRPGPWVLDGVGVARALRKWRALNPGQPPPLEKLIVLTQPHRELLAGQAAMAKGVAKVLEELLGWLGERVEWGAGAPRSTAPAPNETRTRGLLIHRETRTEGIY